MAIDSLVALQSLRAQDSVCLTVDLTMPPERTPSETSPLLGPTTSNPSLGAIPGRQDSEETVVPTEDQGKEPFPDAQKQLKYIIPAISIGVCCCVVLNECFDR